MSTWNYRVMRHTHRYENDEEEINYYIHEVHYDDEGKVTGWTKDPASFADEDASFPKLIERLNAALSKPTLDYMTGKEIDA